MGGQSLNVDTTRILTLGTKNPTKNPTTVNVISYDHTSMFYGSTTTLMFDTMYKSTETSTNTFYTLYELLSIACFADDIA